jgi:hypothetical protein
MLIITVKLEHFLADHTYLGLVIVQVIMVLIPKVDVGQVALCLED